MTNLYRTHCHVCGTERGYLDHCCPNPRCGQSTDPKTDLLKLAECAAKVETSFFAGSPKSTDPADERVVDQLGRALEHITTRQVGDHCPGCKRIEELELQLDNEAGKYWHDQSVGFENQLGDAYGVIWQLKQDLAKAQANYQFMVDRAANEKLDGYRELGAKLAAAENRIDVLTRQLPWAKPWTKTAPLNESNDINLDYQAGQQDSEAWKLLERIVIAYLQREHGAPSDLGRHEAELSKAIGFARVALKRRSDG